MKKNSLIKLLITTLVLVVLTTSICGCGNSNSSISTESISNSTSTPTDPPIDISIFKEVKASPDNIEIYQQEVTSRLESLKENESFISEEEWKVISESEFITENKYKYTLHLTTFNESNEKVIKYNYPVIFKDGASLILWYTSSSGILLFKEIYGKGNIGDVYGDKIHYTVSGDDEIIISSKTEYTVSYSEQTGEIKLWQFGEILSTITGIPKDSIYCGLSNMYGYIFRSGSDVYSLKAIDPTNKNESVICIAHDVKYVINADYSLDSHYNSQPLLQMLDGSIKVYAKFDDYKDDSENFLLPLQNEGGYNK